MSWIASLVIINVDGGVKSCRRPLDLAGRTSRRWPFHIQQNAARLRIGRRLQPCQCSPERLVLPRASTVPQPLTQYTWAGHLGALQAHRQTSSAAPQLWYRAETTGILTTAKGTQLSEAIIHNFIFGKNKLCNSACHFALLSVLSKMSTSLP